MKIKSCIIVFFSTVLLNTSHAQDIVNFYRDINISDSLFYNNELDSACFQYQKAIVSADFVHTRVLRRVLKVSIEADNKPLIKKCEALIKSQEKYPNNKSVLVAEIDSLLKLDKKVRSNKYGKASQYYKKHIGDTTLHQTAKFIKAEKLYKEWLTIDSTNITRVLELIEEHGFLGEQELGSLYANKFQVLLIHFDRDVDNKILSPILLKALHENKITPFTYTSIFDRHLYNTSKTQKYWTWMIVDEDPKLSEDKIKEVLALRESIGMFGTEYEVLYNGGTWNLNNLSGTTY